MQQLPVLTFYDLKAILERCTCTVVKMADYGDVADEEPESALYSIERGEGESLKYAVIHIWDPLLPVPHDTIRSVCMALDLGPEIFGIAH